MTKSEYRTHVAWPSAMQRIREVHPFSSDSVISAAFVSLCRRAKQQGKMLCHCIQVYVHRMWQHGSYLKLTVPNSLSSILPHWPSLSFCITLTIHVSATFLERCSPPCYIPHGPLGVTGPFSTFMNVSTDLFIYLEILFCFGLPPLNFQSCEIRPCACIISAALIST